MTARVWLAASADVAVVVALMGEFRDWLGSDRPSNQALLESVGRLMAGDEAEFLLGVPKGGSGAAGVCQLRYRYGLWHSAEDCWLEDLYIQQTARRSGLGRALVEAALERAAARGCRRVELDANSDNAPALALYGALGFSAETESGARRLMLRRVLAPVPSRNGSVALS